MFMRHTRIIATEYGELDTFQLLEEERPEPKRGEVRVRVLAAGVFLARPDDARGRSYRRPGCPSLQVGIWLV
jgi:NADPH:quinone reductase-like Zn-dependent oxidoreductase